jgi:hypothetical protein
VVGIVLNFIYKVSDTLHDIHESLRALIVLLDDVNILDLPITNCLPY